jgi:hypothetical protein
MDEDCIGSQGVRQTAVLDKVEDEEEEDEEDEEDEEEKKDRKEETIWA